MITSVGVVVPVRDEELLLPDCLRALSAAVRRVTADGEIDVTVVVVLDGCTDGSGRIANAWPDVTVLSIDAGNVGAARATGCAELLRRHQPSSPSSLWLASTDADSRVPEHWLSRQIELADAGAELVLGTVTVDDWTAHPDHLAQQWAATYDGADGHPHVHGANVGCRADAYLCAGGFPGLSCGEDVSLAQAMTDRAIMRVGDIAVTTSARLRSRTTGGFASYLAQLA